MPKTYKWSLLFFLLVGLLNGGAKPDYSRSPPSGFVRLKDLIPTLQTSIRYHTADNFTGAPLPGYGAPDAWMLDVPAKALLRAQESLAKQGLGLLIYDAYRPKRATKGMVAWAERNQLMELFTNGYIARHSGHNHGHTVDLTLIELATGKPLDMGTPWDTLDERSHTYKAKGEALKNRLLLKKEMEAVGFRYYYKEWWHFGMKLEGSRSRDVPYGCFEPPEGNWSPPPAWNTPRFEMPKSWLQTPCSKETDL
jgi:D-alanyl-D-alanine dipeptidase